MSIDTSYLIKLAIFAQIIYPTVFFLKDMYLKRSYTSGLCDGYDRAVNEVKKSVIRYDDLHLERFRSNIHPDDQKTKQLLENSLRALLLPRFRISILDEMYILRPNSNRQSCRTQLMSQSDSDKYDDHLCEIFAKVLTKEFVSDTRFTLLQQYNDNLRVNVTSIIQQYDLLTMY
jgi:hypothetical protein